MSGNEGLNAGASSFTPGAAEPLAGARNYYHNGSVERYDSGDYNHSHYDYEDEEGVFYSMMESEMDDYVAELRLVEQMNEASLTSTTTAAATSSLPPHLAKHAAEFWFPEARDCSCCQGYKHGCVCCTSSGAAVCIKCSAGGGGTQAAASSLSFRRPHDAGSSSGRAGSSGRGRASPGGGGAKKMPCKFFASPSGCRFGDACRFSHQI